MDLSFSGCIGYLAVFLAVFLVLPVVLSLLVWWYRHRRKSAGR